MPISLSRRTLLASVPALLIGSGAHAYDRVQAGERYRRWCEVLESNLQTLSAHLPLGEKATPEDVAHRCARSVVPGSRAATNLSDWLNLSRREREFGLSGPRGSSGPMVAIKRLLTQSLPAGDGGLFPEPSGSPYPDRTLRVWYVHVEGGERLERYFADPDRFNPYRLPPEGTLERKAYPFLLFEERGNQLRLGGFSTEWIGAAEFARSLQFG